MDHQLIDQIINGNIFNKKLKSFSIFLSDKVQLFLTQGVVNLSTFSINRLLNDFGNFLPPLLADNLCIDTSECHGTHCYISTHTLKTNVTFQRLKVVRLDLAHVEGVIQNTNPSPPPPKPIKMSGFCK